LCGFIGSGKGFVVAGVVVDGVVVSSSEVKKVVAVAQKIDEHVFITATPLKQVYGNFFIKPLE
jgi:uncharacterized protein YebE (UPF0316 family)